MARQWPAATVIAQTLLSLVLLLTPTEVLAVVDLTMQPTQASLWLRPQAPSRTVGGTGHGQPPAVV